MQVGSQSVDHLRAPAFATLTLNDVADPSAMLFDELFALHELAGQVLVRALNVSARVLNNVNGRFEKRFSNSILCSVSTGVLDSLRHGFQCSMVC